MPKDNEKIPLPDPASLISSEIQPFSLEQMVRCEACLRANPPTRVNCMYCGAVLPVTEKTAQLQKPGLRRLEKWENGINTILLRADDGTLSEETLRESSNLLKLQPEELQRIILTARPLPLARAASDDEAALIFRRLSELGIETFAVSDQELKLEDQWMVRVRTASIDDERITGYQIAGGPGIEFTFKDLVLLVFGRLFVRRVEVKERRSRRAEDDIVQKSEFFTDEAVLDIYAHSGSAPWRIEASSFDFSVLGERKGLVAGDNLNKLIELIRERSSHVELDQSYTSLRQTLEPVWRSEQRTEASGWHRERPGKYSTSDVTERSNENQFTRYSRLQYYLKLRPPRLDT